MAASKSVPATVNVTKLAQTPKAPVLGRALEAENEFRPYYADDSLGAGMALIEPPYNPAILQRVVSENNTLAPCIDAMITNIDLTGYIIEREDGTTMPKAFEEYVDPPHMPGRLGSKSFRPP